MNYLHREYVGFMVPERIKILLKKKAEKKGISVTELGNQILLEWEKKVKKKAKP